MHVDVTKPATPTSIDPQLLPANARRASAMAGLTTDQKVCIDATIYGTIQGDASIAADQGKLAGVMGGAMAVCGGDTFAKKMVEGVKTFIGLTDDQVACIQSTMTTNQDMAAQLLGALVTVDVNQLIDALAAFEGPCGFTLPDK